VASVHLLSCPQCGETENLGLNETYRAMHPIRAELREGVLSLIATHALATACPSQWFDDGAGDYSLHCWSCAHDWDLPAGTDIDWA
jgi:hypothetical protein